MQGNYTADDFFERGRQRFAKGDLDRAIADFTRAIEISFRPSGDRQSLQDWETSLSEADAS